jgi:hypothetical protein
MSRNIIRFIYVCKSCYYEKREKTDRTMPKGRPGGNPELKKYQFEQKYNWGESCTEQVSLRIPPSMKAAIKAGKIEDWQEIARQAIAAELEKAEKQKP